MGHEVMSCPNCDNWVMEGANRWDCECGYVLSEENSFVWLNPDGLTLKERNYLAYTKTEEYKLLTDSNFDKYIDHLKYCKRKKEMPNTFSEYINYLSFF